MLPTIDLNCDIGESFGAWKMGSDSEIMDYVSSVNIACGFHAGDATTIRRTVEKALEKNVRIGAHPSYPDLQGFGRRPMSIPPEEVFDLVLYQISAVKGICEALGGRLHHIKPHGALYNSAAVDAALASAIARAVQAVDENLIFYGLSGSFLIEEAKKLNLTTSSEVFADRSYEPGGGLTPRSHPGALIVESEKAVAQVLQMAVSQTVTTRNGLMIPIIAETVCIHGDGARAAEFARTVSESLRANGIRIAGR